METNNDFSPHQSLQLIESMINKAKDNFNEDGHLYLLWGWLVFFCSTTEFVLYHFFQYPYHYWVWIISIVAIIYQAFYLARKYRTQKVHTYTEHILGYVWITFAILTFLIGYLIGRLTLGDYFWHIYPVVLALYGMPVFLSGIILRFNPLRFGGIGCWLLSVITTFLEYDYQMLMLSVAMVIAWIIPGYLLRAKYKSVITQ